MAATLGIETILYRIHPPKFLFNSFLIIRACKIKCASYFSNLHTFLDKAKSCSRYLGWHRQARRLQQQDQGR